MDKDREWFINHSLFKKEGTKMTNEELKVHANNIQKNIITEVYSAKSGHPGGSLSAADILTELYFEQMDINS